MARDARRRAQALRTAGLLLLPWLAFPGSASADDPGVERLVASEPGPSAPEPAGGYAYDEYDALYFDDEPEEADDKDPIEGFNRGVFWFNDGLDRYVLEPVATGLDYAVPDVAQRALRNAFDNLRFPIVFFNDLFQLKPVGAAKSLGRFVVNLTVGLGGLMDPAAKIGLPARNEDFGQTLGYWGVPAGPYLMLPFFGPSNVRDAGGLIVDTGFQAVAYFIPIVASVAMGGVDTLNRRSLIREQIRAERRAALDWYAAVRSAYSQYRENLVHDERQLADAEAYRATYPAFEADPASHAPAPTATP